MANQSYGGSGLFGQLSFGDYSGLSGGVPVQMTSEQIQQQLDFQRLQDYENLYANKYESPENSAFNANINSRYIGLPTNPYVNTPRDPLRTALSQADYIKQQEGNPVLAVDQMSVNNEPSSNLPTAPVVSAKQVAMPAPAALAAPTSVLGMFPEVDAMQRALYQQKQNEAMQAQAMQYARLDPMQQAQYSLYMGGQQLGGAIGGALGAKDPQLQMIGLQQQILRELDPSDPAQQLRVARKYAQAAPELAMKIADNALSSQVKIAQINRERKAAIGVPLQVSDRINELKQKMRMLSPDSVEYKDAEEEITRLMKPEKPEPRPSVGSDTERISLDKFGKNYYDLDQPQRAVVSKLVEEDAIKKAPKVQVDLNDKTAAAKASLDVMGKWEGFLKSGGDVEVAARFKQVQSSVSMAGTGNASADGALLYNIAKMYDPSGAVQANDKQSILGNPKIADKFKLLVQGVLEGGTFTPQQRKDLLKIATEIVKSKQSQLGVYRKQYIKKNNALGGDESDILDPYQGLLPLDAFVQ